MIPTFASFTYSVITTTFALLPLTPDFVPSLLTMQYKLSFLLPSKHCSYLQPHQYQDQTSPCYCFFQFQRLHQEYYQTVCYLPCFDYLLAPPHPTTLLLSKSESLLSDNFVTKSPDFSLSLSSISSVPICFSLSFPMNS